MGELTAEDGELQPSSRPPSSNSRLYSDCPCSLSLLFSSLSLPPLSLRNTMASRQASHPSRRTNQSVSSNASASSSRSERDKPRPQASVST